MAHLNFSKMLKANVQSSNNTGGQSKALFILLNKQSHIGGLKWKQGKLNISSLFDERNHLSIHHLS